MSRIVIVILIYKRHSPIYLMVKLDFIRLQLKQEFEKISKLKSSECIKNCRRFINCTV
jgi:hypothetical protein